MEGGYSILSIINNMGFLYSAGIKSLINRSWEPREALVGVRPVWTAGGEFLHVLA